MFSVITFMLCHVMMVMIGPEDNVKCYWCGGSLKAWQPTDNPIVEHFRWFPQCKLSHQHQHLQRTQLPSQTSVSMSCFNPFTTVYGGPCGTTWYCTICYWILAAYWASLLHNGLLCLSLKPKFKTMVGNQKLA